MEEITFNMLVSALAEAARKTFLELFENGEKFYYCALITDSGMVNCPHISAWSWEALEEEADESLKWEWADSPYMLYGDENFSNLRELFNRLPTINLSDENNWKAQFDFRVGAMIAALEQLDLEGIFALNQPRESIVINVEMTDGYENMKRALRLNKAENIKEYLEEGYYADDGRR